MKQGNPQYQPRAVRFHRLIALGEWQVKLYGISLPGADVPSDLEDAALRAARTVLPVPAVSDGRAGIGVVTAHAAPSRSYVLVAWWAEQNELHQRILSAPPTKPEELAAHPGPAIGCVWELGVTDFERRAWITDVLSPAEGPRLARYLGREYNEVF